MLYLASTSPRRKKLLTAAKISFRGLKPIYEEPQITQGSPSKIVSQHALAKAKSATTLIKSGTIVGADTVVFFKRKIIGKPKNRLHAFKILSALEGNWHTVYTGVALIKLKESRIISQKVFYEKTRVRIKLMNRQAIENYFQKVNVLDKAGAYAIQSKKSSIVAEIKGSYSNAVGLPLERLALHIAYPNSPQPSL